MTEPTSDPTSEPESDPTSLAGDGAAGDAPTSTEVDSAPKKRKKSPDPFDYPFVFPGLLLCLALWFGYDGWLNPETESITFNRIVFGILMVLFTFTFITDYRMWKRDQAKQEESKVQEG